MDLRTWTKKTPIAERRRVAKAAGTSVDYLMQLAGNHRRPSWELAVRIEEATDGDVTRDTLRPDIWPPESVAANG